MGFNLAWVGVEARNADRLLDYLDLERHGEASHELDGDFTFAELPEGWVVVVVDGYRLKLDKTLAGVSASCGFAIGCELIETVTFSRM